MELLDLYHKSDFKKLIIGDLQDNKLSHAYLLCGQDEFYLNYLAKNFSKNILCKEMCQNCNICNNIEKNIYADVLNYPQASQSLLVEDVNQIATDAYILPLEGDKKIYIINMDNATVQAQNKLLKTLEEPPGKVLFILYTTMQSNVLNTIKSRSKIINIPLLNKHDVEQFILSNSLIAKSDVANYSAWSQGSLAKALKVINDKSFIKIKEDALNTILHLNESKEMLKYSGLILEHKDRLNEVFDELNLIILDILYVKSNLLNFVVNTDKINEFKNTDFSIKALNITHELILKSQDKLKSNCMPNSVVDGFLLTMLEVKHKWKL